jgi:hypothetical protein
VRLAVSAALALLLAGCGGDVATKPLIARSKTAVVRGELTPSVHLFAEPIVARVDVILDREKVDPAAVRLNTDFEPYEIVGETRVSRTDIGGYTHLRYAMTLRCLNERCIPRTASGETTVSQVPGLPPFLPGQQRDEKVKYEFPPALVIAEAEPKDMTLGRVVWTPLRSLSRLNWDDSSVVGQGFPFVANVAPVAEPDYRISPTALGVALLSVALALLALPVWRIQHRRARVAPQVQERPALSPLERALALVEWASHRPSVDDRREALEALAHELEGGEDDELVRRAREQGWRPPSPVAEEMTGLVATVKESDAPAT